MAKEAKFNHNKIDATMIKGAVTKWMLEGGKQYDPANVVTDPVNLVTTKLVCWTNSGKKDYEHTSKEDVDFDINEDVKLTGPVDGVFSFNGVKSGDQAQFKG